MKYAIVEPADQTIAYLSFWDGQVWKRRVTPYHEDALLFESLEDVQSIVDRINQDQFQRDLVNHDDLTKLPLPWAAIVPY
jgi:hypothetical protein